MVVSMVVGTSYLVADSLSLEFVDIPLDIVEPDNNVDRTVVAAFVVQNKMAVAVLVVVVEINKDIGKDVGNRMDMEDIP